MNSKFVKTLWLFLLFPVLLFSQTEKFNVDSAYSYIEHLTETIGPRPMGTLNEQTALKWAVQKFNSFGADTAYIMEITNYKKGRSTFNTQSGIAIGIFNGQTDSSIVIGGHIDSAAPEIAGANDDASGTASVLELARIWSKKDRRYTMVFTTFGGEESGLVGSSYFVNHYDKLKKIKLMLQIDMTASDDDIYILSDSDSIKSPIWLVQDAFDLNKSLEIDRLMYPAHFATINNVIGGAGSDHQPFLSKGIPAIDFTVGINNSPIHTQQDRLEFVDKNMLKKCGMLINGLIEKYQTNGIPGKPGRNYELWQFFGMVLFVPPLFVKIFIVISILLGILAFIYGRKNRLIIPKPERVRFSGWKLFLLMVCIAVFAQLGEAILQLIKGVRYPWFIQINSYLFLSAIWTVLGAWISLQITKKWTFSPDSYVYSKRALILLLLFVLIMILGSVRLAVYPASALFFFSLAVLIPNRTIKIIMILFTPILPLKLMFMEAFPFLAHMLAQTGLSINEFWESSVYTGALTLFLVFSYLPLIYIISFGIVNINSMKKFFIGFRKPVSGLIVLLVIIGFSGYLLTLPAYNNKWRPIIHVNANYNINKNESKLKIAGSEFLKNVKIESDSINKIYDENILQEFLPISFEANWIKLSGIEEVRKGEKDTVNIDWQLVSTRPMSNATITLSVDSAKISDVKSDLSFFHQNNQLVVNWRGDLADTLFIKTSLTIEPNVKLIRDVVGEFTKMPINIHVDSDLSDVQYRTKVTFKDTIKMDSTSE